MWQTRRETKREHCLAIGLQTVHITLAMNSGHKHTQTHNTEAMTMNIDIYVYIQSFIWEEISTSEFPIQKNAVIVTQQGEKRALDV